MARHRRHLAARIQAWLDRTVNPPPEPRIVELSMPGGGVLSVPEHLLDHVRFIQLGPRPYDWQRDEVRG